MAEIDTKQIQDRQAKTIERLNTSEPKSIVKILSKLWYILENDQKHLLYIPNYSYTEEGVKRSDKELEHIRQAQSEISRLIQKYKGLYDA